MDSNRYRGSVRKTVGALKEIAGRMLGDKKLTAQGRAEKVVGKIQGAVGRVMNAFKF